MSTSPDSRNKEPSTYFVQDRSSKDEMKRLQVQDQMMTAAMGGVLTEQSDPTRFQHVLDVGCGTGGWLIEVARAYPNVSRAVGIDISSKMVEYASSQAGAHGVADRVEFQLMDVLNRLQFPNDSFDFINMRFGQSYLRKWDWPNVLSEFKRVSRPGGVIRLTDTDLRLGTNSPGLARLGELSFQALYNAGHSFAPEGVTSEFAALLTQYAGATDIQTHVYSSEYRAGTAEWRYFYEDMKHMYRTILPFMRKWTKVPDDYERIYQQAMTEIAQPESATRWNLVTTWGTVSAIK